LLEWDRLADEHPSWLAPDGVHLGGQAGIEGYAQMIATALPYAVAVQGPARGTQPQPSEPAGTESELSGESSGAPTTLEVTPQSRKAAPDRARRSHRTDQHPHSSKAALRARRRPPRVPAAKAASTELAEKSARVLAPASSRLSTTETAIIAAGAALLAVLLAVAVRRRRAREQ
jgi:hypothetical protein